MVLQDAHPEPPVLDLAALEFDVQWRALLRLRLVADAELSEPRLFLHLPQLRQEREDEVDIEERGWNRALEETYPLEINELRVLADPIPDLSANLEIHKLPLDRLEPIIEDYHLSVRRGELSAEGNVLYGSETRRVTLDELRIDGVHIDYVSDPTLTRRAAAAVAEADRQQKTQVLVRRLRLTRSELGFVNRTRNPDYRVFLTDLELTLDGWSNLPDADPSLLRARGSFMGSGRTAVQGAFRPDSEGADFELAVAIEDTRLAAMNDLLRAYANFDVTGGAFSFYSEVRVADGEIDGYVKPLFHGVEAYDPEQDREQNFFRRLWERLAEGVAEILENRPREDVATVADISGPVASPETSNLEVVLNLVENAFFDAILPGFQAQAEGGD